METTAEACLRPRGTPTHLHRRASACPLAVDTVPQAEYTQSVD